jgi:hypothetical protein
MKKDLSLIHMARAISLLPKLETEDGQLELVATYLATASTLLAARKDASAMESVIAQAAELPAPEAAEVMADFFSQLASYNKTLVVSLPREMTGMLPGTIQTPDSSSSNS